MMRLILVLVLSMASPAWAQTVRADRFTLGGVCTIRYGSGSPEGAVTGVVCDEYHQSNSPYDKWRKVSGSSTTGWVKMTTGLTFGTALTKTDDTNVTLTLGGSASTALLNAASLTLGWTGQLSLARGGTNANLTAANGAIPYSTASAIAFLAPTATAGQMLRSGSSAAPTWSTTTWPSTSTANRVLYSTGTNTVGDNSGLTYNGSVLNVETAIGSSGNLTLSPTGDLITNPTGNDILPTTNYDINIGSPSLKYLSLNIGELIAETLVAQDVMATIGGRVLVAPTTLLTADLAAATTTITVKHNNLASGDRVYMQASPGGTPQVEFLAVTSGAGGSAGAYTYTVTRNLDGSGANQWYAGDAVLNTGTTGDGFIDLYSNAGVLSGTGPTIVGNVRTGTTYSDVAARWAIGNLNGMYGYGASDVYGAAFGSASGTNVTVDSTNGFRIRSSTTDKFVADTSGNLSIVGDLSVGTSGVIRSGATAYGTGTGYWLDYNSGTPRFRVGTVSGNRIAWDGTNIAITSANFTASSSGVTVVPAATAAFNVLNGYGFSPVSYGGTAGVFAYEASSSRSLGLSNDVTGGNDARTSLNAAHSSGPTASIQLIANSSSADITARGDTTVFGDVTISDGTAFGYGTGKLVATAVSSQRGSVSATNGVATTVFTAASDTTAVYLVSVGLNVGGASTWAAFATVAIDGASARIVANNTANMTLTLSGMNVQAAQVSGSTQTIYWSVVKIG